LPNTHAVALQSTSLESCHVAEDRRANPKTFFGELKRRNVYKVAVAYVVAGWALAQGLAQVLPVFAVPNWVIQLLVLLIILGLPIALGLAWAFELTPEGLKRTDEVDEATAATHKKRAWVYVVIIGAVVSIGLFFLGRYSAVPARHAAVDNAIKSIAVLPFENLSDDKENTYFADGVQDQILTNLGRVSDLKVISHTSVSQYKSGEPRNLREIGKQLGVTHILEGSVRRAGDRLRISAQLIDARTDSQIWADTYDRTAADLFAIQSDLAQSIVAQLQAKLSPQQKAEIEQRPTQDLLAFELYQQAKQIVDSYLIADDIRTALLSALQSLDQAIKRDPDFLSAYCYIARANDLLYFFDLDPTDRILLAEAAVKAALRLRPNSAEAHFAMGDFLFRCHRDYDGALKELAIARPGLPNDTAFFILSGYINRRRNNWSQAQQDFSTAVALDPRNPNAYNLLADTYNLQRKHFLAAQVYDRVLAAGERTPIVFYRRDSAIFNGTGNSTEMRDVLAKNPDMDVGGGQTPFRVLFALIDRNFAEAERVLAVSPRKDFQDIDYSFSYPKAWFEAMIGRAKGDSARATAAFSAARTILEQRLAIKPQDARTIAVLAQVDAGLGRKELAIQEAQHAVDLMPLSKDVYDGALVLEGLAQVYTWTNEPDRAIELLQKLAAMPSYVNYGRLKLHPMWNPLRGDPRFEKIVNSLAPK